MTDNHKGTRISEPPRLYRERSDKSKWEEIFAEARSNRGQWHQVLRPMSKSTVVQLASDIRNSAGRDNVRINGILDDEEWDATWGEVDDEYFIWIRLA